jgi:SanA protein
MPPGRHAFGQRLKRQLRRGLFLAGFVVLGLLATNAWVLARGCPKMVEPTVVEHAPVALVFGAGVHSDGTVSQVLGDRLDTAIDLYVAKKVDGLLLSGDHGAPEYDEVDAMRVYAEKRGVPPEAITLDHAGFDTYSSVFRAKHVFNVSRATLVSQSYHLPRALYLARAEGLEAQGVSADRRDYRGIAWFEAREVLSRTKACLDVLFKRTPKAPQ